MARLAGVRDQPCGRPLDSVELQLPLRLVKSAVPPNSDATIKGHPCHHSIRR